ncbi:manganese-dependent inorganic pyrophosphatase [Celerinatantimonas diazotrophica]|uniref:inorganic diphosphatase n=1 Tax=Celerinatantimonas diazotrophica TaxID=412034 RepID=A0A4R1JLM9_9GAMM|nr:manganese-dependent inorganic pyrophosphatase [Celerinatantimonas diazotrophica]TCK51962.1 manganese-dependent inorganic pyrophosphatase [Celerinatantimonas diazotrophica]CAG9296337.1 Manganese-dependent inorganic pyrophosphatase [Celerinatantimonas diazotrophica]
MQQNNRASSTPLVNPNEPLIHVFGHRNPDSDSICSSLVVADWLNQQGQRAQAFRQGELNFETRYIIKAAGAQQPPLIQSPLNNQKVWLVDFTDAEQGPKTLLESDIVGVIDHHRLGTIVTKNPPNVWIRPVGCSATIVWQIMTHESAMQLTRTQATLLLGAILSDTVALSGPTTTELDKKAVADLTKTSEQDYQKFVTELLKAKTNIAGQSAKTLLQRDAKNYQIADKAILLAQLEVQDLADVQALLPELLAQMKQERLTNKLDMVGLILTDICEHNSVLYFCDSQKASSEPISLPGVTSRKKEVLPWLTDRLKTMTLG